MKKVYKKINIKVGSSCKYINGATECACLC